MPSYTLDELITALKPQAEKDNALSKACIDSLTQLGAELIKAAPIANVSKCVEIGELIDMFPCYWGYEEELESDSALLNNYNEVIKAVHTDPVPPATDEQKAVLFAGLYRYIKEMEVCGGNDYFDEIGKIQTLMKDAAKHWDYTSPQLDEMMENIDTTLEKMKSELSQGGQSL